MTIHLGGLEWVRRLVGIPFPEADEDALRRCARAWRSAAGQLREVPAAAAEIGADVAVAVSGATAEAFARYWQPYADGSLAQIADACDALAHACDHAATQVERAKIIFLTALATLAASLASFGMAVVGAGLVTGLFLSHGVATAQMRIYGVLGALVFAIVLGAAVNAVVDIARNVERALRLLGVDWDIVASLGPPPPGVSGGGGASAPGASYGVVQSIDPANWPGPAVSWGWAAWSGVPGPPVLASNTPLGTVPADPPPPSGGGPALVRPEPGASPAWPAPAPTPAPPPPPPPAPRPVPGPTTPAPAAPVPPPALVSREPAAGSGAPRPVPATPGGPPPPLPAPPPAGPPGAGPAPSAPAVAGPAPVAVPGGAGGAAGQALVVAVLGPGVADARVGSGRPGAVAGSAADGDPDPAPLSDAEALALARRCLFVTDAGYGFYPAGEENRDLARAVRPTPGHVTVDLHGDPAGFTIDSGRLTPSQLAMVLRELIRTGELTRRPPEAIRLAAGGTGDGPASPAATLARELGVEVLAPDRLLWTDVDGEESVASPQLIEGLLIPADPPDGRWHRFGPATEPDDAPVETPSGAWSA